jgi:hypothetical protein
VIICTSPTSTSIDILEINAPPSLDTATGIPAAEATHEGNVGGILKQFVKGLGRGGEEDTWVRLTNDRGEEAIGETTTNTKTSPPPPPNTTNTKTYNAVRSASLNRMKYNLRTRTILRRNSYLGSQLTPGIVASRARRSFRYFVGREEKTAFFENAGGAQVPERVVERVRDSLGNRWRERVGKKGMKER